MSDEEVKTIRIYMIQQGDQLSIGESIELEKNEHPRTAWEKGLARLERFLPSYQWNALTTVIELLRESKKRLTQKELLRNASSTPSKYLDEGAMKKALPLAVDEGVLTGGSGSRSKGYGLPEWDWK